MTVINFDSDGIWNAVKCKGPAIHIPDQVKAIVITSYCIEWLDMSEPDINFYPKNHMVGVVTFAQSCSYRGNEYESARISMEVDADASSEDQVPGVLPSPTLKCGQDYGPGIFTVQLRTYSGPSYRAPHHRTYPIRVGTTIGDLIKPIIDRKMHHFLFLIYTDEDYFKGCGHFILMSWILYLNLGLITNEDSMEDPTMMLSEELTSTYIKEKGGEVKKTFAHVGKGKFLIYDEGDPDQYAPDDMWSRACPKHQLTLEKAGDPEEDTL